MIPIPYKEIIYIVGVVLVIILIILLLTTFMPGCMSAPKRTNYNCNECFMEADCLYRNKDNKDKSICQGHIEDCRKVDQLNRIKENLKYCSENLPKGWSERECQNYLNK